MVILTMKKGYLLLFLGFVFFGAALFWGGKLIKALPKKTAISALEVETVPEAKVFLDGKELGKTPFEDENLSPGEYTLSLLPQENASFSAWQRKIRLNPHLLTYVSYLFGPSEQESAGQTLTLQATGGSKGEIVVVSDPDGVNIFLDGENQGTAPKVLSGLITGEHQLNFSLVGYHERNLRVKTLSGHKLLVNVRLAKEAEKEAQPQASESASPKVKILETPTGWLRIRSQPSLFASESGRVAPGGEYLLLEEENAWFKIRYEEDKEGWISSEYAQKTE